MKAAVLTLTIVAALAERAAADPRLDETVYSPYVENHVAGLEVRHGRQIGGAEGGAGATVIEAEYGVSDRLRLAVVGAVDSAPGGGTRLASISAEGVAYIGRIPGIGVDAGAYFEYGHGLAGATDKIEAKLLLAKTSGRFLGLANLIVERPLGTASGQGFAAYGYALSATWRTVGNLRLGAEAFGDLGDDHHFLAGPQDAYVGPQLKWEGRPRGSSVEVGVDLGWLTAVGAHRGEAQSQARLNLEIERRF